MVVTDNVVRQGAHIGLSVSNVARQEQRLLGLQQVTRLRAVGCADSRARTSGIARHYFYRCTFESTTRGDPRARYPQR